MTHQVLKLAALLGAWLAAIITPLLGLASHGAAPSIVALSQIDGDAGIPDKSTTDQLGDTQSVRALGAALRSYNVTWTTGVKLTFPPDSAREQRAGTLYLTAVPDPTLRDGNGEDNPYRQTPHDVEADLWIPPHATRTPILLEAHPGPRSLRVRLASGSRPSMFVSGLPRGTVSAQFVSSGNYGIRLIGLTDGCGPSAQPERSVTTATFVTGQIITRKVGSSRHVVCNGRSQYVGPGSR